MKALEAAFYAKITFSIPNIVKHSFMSEEHLQSTYMVYQESGHKKSKYSEGGWKRCKLKESSLLLKIQQSFA